MSKKVLIVGGVAGGASAAARLRRLDENAEITIFERGGSVSFANCGLPYHISGVIPNRNNLLLQTPESLYRRFRINVKIQHEVTSIDRQKKQITVKNLNTGEQLIEDYDVLILSPGANAIVPPIPGIDSINCFTLRNMEDTDIIISYIKKNKPQKALIIGCGLIGLEIIENLINLGIDVTAVARNTQIMSALDYEMAVPIQRHLRENGVKLLLKNEVEAFEKGEAVMRTGENIPFDLVIMSLGVVPNSKLAKEAGLDIGVQGTIVVDDHMKTSDDNIYAVGDVVQVRDFVTGQFGFKPLAGPANKQGRYAADNICGIPSVYKGTLGSAIAKVFDLSVGLTGVNEKTIKKAEIPYYVCWLHPASHATYYPGAKIITFKVIFHKETGLILGAQAVGEEGVDKRIDVLSTAIRAGMTIRDLQDLELTYAPPFSSAKDPINMAGYIGANIMDGYNPLLHWEDLDKPDYEGGLLLDVRTPGEYAEGNIKGSLNVQLDELRERMKELPEDKEKNIYVYCRVGLRGYIATRILQQYGYKNVYNLGGGWLTYDYSQD
ncbi:MAG: CoA-disulfide reductase [Eubacteriales bacterium]|nr:CoA-disulfide reductase [Eubacteriales bacterium]